MVEPGPGDGTQEAASGEQQADGECVMEDGGTAAVGFGISGTGEGKVVLGRFGQRDDKELRYLHLLWEPGRAELGAGGMTSKPGKMTGSRAKRHHRAVRKLGPIGQDIYGKVKGLLISPLILDTYFSLCTDI